MSMSTHSAGVAPAALKRTSSPVRERTMTESESTSNTDMSPMMSAVATYTMGIFFSVDAVAVSMT